MFNKDLEKLVVKLFNGSELTQKDHELIKQCIQNNQICRLLIPNGQCKPSKTLYTT